MLLVEGEVSEVGSIIFKFMYTHSYTHNTHTHTHTQFT